MTLIFWMLQFGSAVHAARIRPPRPEPPRKCDRALSGDERLARLDARPLDAKVLAARAQLMNEAWWPALTRLRELVLRHSADEISLLARAWKHRLDFDAREDGPAGSTSFLIRQMGYDARFESHFRMRLRPSSGQKLGLPPGRTPLFLDYVMCFPFFPHNRSFMAKVYLASVVLMSIIDTHEDELQDALPKDGLDVLRKYSFTRESVPRALYFAVKTLGQTFALVTADPVAGVDAEELARRASRPKRATSTIERLALKFPPALLGRYGDDHFVACPVRLDDEGRTELTRRMQGALAGARAYRAGLEPLNRWEFGTGCPMAFPSPERGQRSGVGLTLEAFWHVYDHVPSDRRGRELEDL